MPGVFDLSIGKRFSQQIQLKELEGQGAGLIFANSLGGE